MLAAMDIRCVNYVNVRILVMVAASASLRFLRHCLDKAEHTYGNRLRSHCCRWGNYDTHMYCVLYVYWLYPEAGWLTAFYGSLVGISRGWKWDGDLKGVRESGCGYPRRVLPR